MSDQNIVVPTEGRQVTRFTKEHAQEIRLPSPEAVNYMASVCRMLAGSALVTKDMFFEEQKWNALKQRGYERDDIANMEAEQIRANMMAKMLVGYELGIDPIQSLQDIDIVKGRIFTRYPQLVRLIEEKGYVIEEVERTHERAAIKLTHPVKPAREFEFTLGDAQKAGLVSAGGQYEKRPRVMLYSRAISEAYRATGGKGTVYSMEEKEEVEREEVAPSETRENPYHVEAVPKQIEAAKTDIPEGGAGPASPATATGTPETGSGKGESPARSDTPQAGSLSNEKQAAEKSAQPQASAEPGNGAPPAESAAKAGHSRGAVSQQSGTYSANIATIQRLIPAADLRDGYMQAFARGFLNVGRVPKNDPKIIPAMAYMARIAETDMSVLDQDAKAAGLLAGVGWNALARFVDGWPKEDAEIAHKIALERYPKNAKDLMDYLAEVADTANMAPTELHAFVSVLARTKQAIRLKDQSEAAGRLMQDIVNSWGLDLATCTEGEILGKLSWAGQAPATAQPDLPEEPDTLWDLDESPSGPPVNMEAQ